MSSQESDNIGRKKDGNDSERARADSTTHPDDEHHHLITTSQWTVTDPQSIKPFGPSLPDDYDSTAHGWTVTPIRHSHSDSAVTFLIRKKKKKRYRKHKSISYNSSSESDSEEKEEETVKSKVIPKKKIGIEKNSLELFKNTPKFHKQKDDLVSSSDDIKWSKSKSDFTYSKFKVSPKSRFQSPDQHPHSTMEDPCHYEKHHTKHYSERHVREEDEWRRNQYSDNRGRNRQWTEKLFE